MSSVGTPICVRRKWYPSISAAARAHDIPVYVLRNRLRRGWKPNKAVSEPWRTRSRGPVQVGDTVYSSQLAAARAAGLSQGAIGERVHRGVPPELMDSDDPVIGQGVRVGEKLYPSLRVYAREIGRPHHVVLKARQRGVPLEDLADPDWRPPWARQEVIVGKRYPSLSAAAKTHGISLQLASQRVERGMSPEEAVLTPTRP